MFVCLGLPGGTYHETAQDIRASVRLGTVPPSASDHRGASAQDQARDRHIIQHTETRRDFEAGTQTTIITGEAENENVVGGCVVVTVAAAFSNRKHLRADAVTVVGQVRFRVLSAHSHSHLDLLSVYIIGRVSRWPSLPFLVNLDIDCRDGS